MMSATGLNDECRLTDLDWRVVEVARIDGPRSINPDRRLARFLRHFFGLPIARRLANERAEALRRFCVRAWYWDRIHASDMRPLTDAGYSMADVLRILAHVAGYRGFIPTIQEGAI
ncbi:MAG: hypothetical protein ACXWUX_07805 [Allosphingosinicella sp.]